MSQNKPIVTRFAPSPTGLLHAGNYRTALFSYLFARQNDGKFILRIEDTDRERSKKEYEENILESLKWLGLEHDAFYRQSEQLENHKKHLNNLIEKGFAYVSKEEREGKVNEIVRFKNPGTKVTFKDMIRGEITVDTTDLKDFVIAKNINEPLFHLAVVVDDFEMGVTHVVRGEDHISNTPRQILIQRAIGAPEPVYAHLPLILAPDRSKLSKRKGALAITEYRDRGYLSDAIVNYLALLGWNPGTDQEILSKEDLLKLFNIEKIQKGGAIFNEEKLKWINKEYLKKMPALELEKIVTDLLIQNGIQNSSESLVKKISPILLDRISTLAEIPELIKQGEVSYFFAKPEFPIEMLSWKGKSEPEKTKERLNKVITFLEKIPADTFTDSEVKNALWEYASAEGRGEVLWPTRVALSGREKSPDPFALANILGKEETISRLHNAISRLT